MINKTKTMNLDSLFVRFYKSVAQPIPLAVLIILVVIASASTVAWQILSQTRIQLETRLQASLTASIYQVKQQINQHKLLVSYWAENADFKHQAQLFSQSLTDDGELEKLLTPTIEAGNYRDYQLLDKHGTILLSKTKSDIGTILPMDKLSESIEQVWNGVMSASQSFASPQFRKDYMGWKSDNLPTMLAMAPVLDNNGNTMFLLSFEFDPERILLPIFHNHGYNETGEIYGLDRNGLLLTESKYTKQLRDIGLLDKPHSAMQLILHDPGVNLLANPAALDSLTIASLPLTQMAQAISRDEEGSNVENYNDYRGVPVVGVWRWDDELQMGFASEVDVDEALVLYRTTLKSIQIGVTIVIIFIIFATFLYLRLKRKAAYTEQQRDAIINHTPDGIITINTDAIMMVVNPSAAKMFGYQVDELLGRNVSMLLPMELRDGHDDYVQSSELYETRVFDDSLNLHGYRKDGSLFPLELTLSPMVLGDHKYYIGMIRDITERHESYKALVAAKEQAEQANNAKSEFLSRMSHELRTPLNAILGFSQLLALDDLSEDQLESINTINLSGRHLLNLINDVLDLAQIESGHIAVSLESVDVTQLIKEIIRLLEAELLPLNLTLSVDSFSDDSIWVVADYMKLKQVLINLLSNAVKYNRPEGFIKIIISQQSHNKIRLAVQDGGNGLESTQLARLFQPFDRLGQESSTIEGTGIGLVISSELVRLMKGELEVASVVGTGTTFSLVLPEADAQEYHSNGLKQDNVTE